MSAQGWQVKEFTGANILKMSEIQPSNIIMRGRTWQMLRDELLERYGSIEPTQSYRWQYGRWDRIEKKELEVKNMQPDEKKCNGGNVIKSLNLEVEDGFIKIPLKWIELIQLRSKIDEE